MGGRQRQPHDRLMSNQALAGDNHGPSNMRHSEEIKENKKMDINI